MKPSLVSAKGGLFRGLAIPFTAFVLAASLALVAWIDSSYQRESLRQFRETATANARIVDQLRLPRSPELARNLATVLGVGVGFRFQDTPTTGLDQALEAAVDGLIPAAPASARVAGRDLAVATLADGTTHLVLMRDGHRGLPGASTWLLPSLIVAALGGGLAFLVSRRLVRPLVTLNRWLPNLDSEKPDPIPLSVTARSDEIGALARSLEDGHRRLREEQELRRQSERLATLGRIATSLAHEIRNPAAAIRMHADLLAREKSGDEAESLDLIRDEVDRITDLVNQWLFVARAAPPRTRPHDLTTLARAVLKRLAPQFDHAGVTTALDGPDGLFVEVDSSRIEQVMRNLFLNAMQAMPSGGKIHAAVRRDGDIVRLEIRDGGAGFSDEAQRRWSEPFFSEREGGMGLGLTLASEVMQAHGGTVSVRNAPDGGAIVRCEFPPLSTESRKA
ncbi:MAG: ATP-binding protein [Verrucomicrobiales bacterium]|jgi:signal transduction histidine kinase|nr:ATP-binding protein [Verrucomicrobiales bacterium]